MLRWLAALSLIIMPALAFGQNVSGNNATLGKSDESREVAGVAWPVDYNPDVPMVTLPSQKAGLRAKMQFPERRLKALDLQPILKEDLANRGIGNPPRVGIGRAIEGSLDGEWNDIGASATLWSAAVTSEGSLRTRLHFTDVNIPSGGELYVYDPYDPTAVFGPFTGKGPKNDGEFWAPSIRGETVRIEYLAPDRDAFGLPFNVDELGHMYSLGEESETADRGLRSPLSCMLDVACYPDWEDISNAVAKISFYEDGSWYNCTGTLLAAVNDDLTPYFLTGAHCIDNDTVAATCEFEWFYQHSSCGGSLMPSQFSYYGDVLGTSGYNGNITGADWTLMMVKGVLPADVFWSGWTSSDPSSGSWAYGVHHPSGSWKRWSRGLRYSGGYYFHYIDYDQGYGTIYYGSSGSGMWTVNGGGDQLLFGNCSFGYGEAGCDNTDVGIYYGRFAQYYGSISSYLSGGSDDILENNDSCVFAPDLEDGYYGSLVVKSLDEDWYRVSLGVGDQLEVDLFFTDSYGNINAQLYDSCGGTVVASATSYTNDESLVYQNTGGTSDFYLRVYLADDTRNTYDMSVAGSFLDCNDSGIADICDVSCAMPECAGLPGCGESYDCNTNNIPDECETDCNVNGIADECEIADLIASQPTNQEGCSNVDSVVFNVTSSTGTDFQWYKGTTPLTDDARISGSSTNELTITGILASDEDSYYCHVAVGCIENDSDSATLTVNVTAEITDQPDNADVCPGNTASFTVVAAGPDVQYTWSRGGVPLSDDGRISGSHAATLLIADANGSDIGDYSCHVSNMCGEDDSATASLSMEAWFTQQPQDTCAELGQNAVFHAEAETLVPGTANYYWKKGSTYLSDGGNISGSYTDTLTISGVSAGDAGQYSVTFQSTNCLFDSEEVTLQVGGCPSCPTLGDMDDDGDFDLVDMAGFTVCFGADVTVETSCVCANVEDSNDLVDLADWAALNALITGP